MLMRIQLRDRTHRLVISKVVPKIWARMNSAMIADATSGCHRITLTAKGKGMAMRMEPAEGEALA